MENIRKNFQNTGLDALQQQQYQNGEEAFYLCLQGFHDNLFTQSLQAAQEAMHQEPKRQIFSETAQYLARIVKEGKQNVYVSNEGFVRFIRGGGNIPLYETSSNALQSIYKEYQQIHILDIGVGDGRALLPALCNSVQQLTLVEPSQTMLDTLISSLTQKGIPHHAICSTFQDFISYHEGSWDLAQATFSIQSIPPQERVALFTWLKKHAPRLILAEFDVPIAGNGFTPQRVRYILERFEQGIAEYANDPIVIQGFLMPIMLGYFDTSAARTNYEQPIQSWIEQLHEAGYIHTQTKRLYPYWWADAYLIDAN